MRTLALILALWPLAALAQFENPAMMGAMTYSTSAAPAGWAPTNAYAWWHADSLVLANGSLVTNWSDSSGNGYTMSAILNDPATYSPLFSNNIVNGLPAMFFNGTVGRRGLTNAFGSTLSQPLTYFMVANISAGNGTPYILDGISAAPRNGIVNLYNGLAMTNEFYAGTDFQLGHTSIASNTWYVFTWVFNGSSSFQRTNGVLDFKVSASPGTDGSTGITLGSRYAASAGTYFKGWVSELIFYNGLPATNDMIWVENNLKSKYGL